jgi:mannose-6-phosphate isomerase-like protein (cupin superfamily)
MTQAARFDPEHLSFDEGLNRLQRIVEKSGLDTRRVITSRDADVQSVEKRLGISAIPGGFTKWQLPVYLNNPAQLYISVGEPNAKVGEHSHDNGDGIRFIVSGSINYGDVELTAGDWMFIPAGKRYSFSVGRFGATMCYCYCCSCAGAADLTDEVVDPPF